MSTLSHLECSKCKRTYDADIVQQLCTCGAPLLARYDLATAAATFTREDLGSREPSLWRYTELLPLRDQAYRVDLHERMTPIIPLPEFGASIGLSALYLKDDGALPTGSFKARGAAIGVSRAKELGVKRFAMPTNGNAGGAWAAYATRAKMEAYLVMPQSAPPINRLECVMAGAHVFLVDGLISDAGRIVAKAVVEHGLYDASTLKEPYRIEGKKTIGFELIEQFEWSVPDVILYPTGGGVGLIGIYKALRELQAMGLIDERMPRFVAVQSEGCAPIVKAFDERKTESAFWPDAHTVAFGITVPKALGDFLVLEAIYETSGTAIAVSDVSIVAMQHALATREGILICPEGAATLSAADELRSRGWIAPDERVVAINTGIGFKYPDVPYPQPPVLQRDDDLPIVTNGRL
jgi:threonine synthase